MTDFRLTTQERDTALWKRIEAEIRERLQDHREANDSIHLDERRTAVLRGQIEQLNELLGWLKAPPPHIDDATEY